MRMVVVCLVVLVAVVSAGVVPEGHQLGERFLFDCDSRCASGGGCYGEQFTRCMGVCYCIGSGYEYRCRNCDI